MESEERKRNSLIATSIFFIVGVIVLISGLDTGWKTGKVVIFIGGFISIAGGLGFKYPQIAETILQFFENNQKAQERERKIVQRQKNTKNSSQNIATGKGKIDSKNSHNTNNHKIIVKGDYYENNIKKNRYRK